MDSLLIILRTYNKKTSLNKNILRTSAALLRRAAESRRRRGPLAPVAAGALYKETLSFVCRVLSFIINNIEKYPVEHAIGEISNKYKKHI